MIDETHTNMKYLTVRELRAILDKLEPDERLYPNAVRNLAVVKNGEYVAWIDFRDGSLNATTGPI